MSPPTSRASALLAAARADGPDAATRDALWAKVASDTVGIVAATPPAVTTTVVTTSTLVKTFAFAAVAAAAVGASLVALPDAVEAPDAAVHADSTARVVPRTFEPGLHRTTLRETSRTKFDPAPLAAKSPEPLKPVDLSESGFAEEARLLTEARTALVAGDPARALALVAKAEAGPSKGLVPEELGIRARALHALGRTDEAAEVELTLKRAYPDHALAR